MATTAASVEAILLVSRYSAAPPTSQKTADSNRGIHKCTPPDNHHNSKVVPSSIGGSITSGMGDCDSATSRIHSGAEESRWV